MNEQEKKQLCECLEGALAKTTLAPGREFHVRSYSYVASGAPLRVRLRLEPSERTRGWAVFVQARETASGGSDAVLLLRMGSATDANATRREMLAGGAFRVMPEKSYAAALPAWQRELVLDAAGVAKGTTTQADVTFTLTVYELAGMDDGGRC